MAQPRRRDRITLLGQESQIAPQLRQGLVDMGIETLLDARRPHLVAVEHPLALPVRPGKPGSHR
ncbi:hypothetical protein ACIRQF_30360 [Streptomyces sp. NPDC101191]|uniref:hypothetical protein n=1 Tax=Streptomyces sp. NPDC101191 TaxID=3366126 RepID=UPI003826938D